CARVAIDEDEDERGQAGRADEGVAWRGRAEEGEAATAGVEASRRLDAETWSDPDVARRLSEATVALRLDWRSPDGVSFLAIYPAFQVPTIYLIAPLTGQPLGILLGFVTPQQFLAKLDECCAALSHPPSSSPAGVQNANRAPAEAPATPQPLSSAEVAAQKERLLKRIEEVKRQKEAQEKQARQAASIFSSALTRSCCSSPLHGPTNNNN
ncbi:uncharacterized protein ACA1_258970, partial [Acanthamoeba castellanii str. Neff]